MEKYKKIGIAKVVLVVLMLIGVLLGSIWIHEKAYSRGVIYVHENEEYKHGPMGGCYGWEKLGSNIRKCFLDKEHIECVNLIYNHGTWHKTEPYTCDKEK